MGELNVNSIQHYFSTQPVLKAWLFGSYARGEQTQNSDVDILVVFEDGVGLFKYAAIASDLEKLLHRNVDLVSDGALFPWVKYSVEQDKVLIYERKATR